MIRNVICKPSFSFNERGGESRKAKEKLQFAQMHIDWVNVKSQFKHLIVLIFPQGFFVADLISVY